jgi:hypothetical protein
MSLEADAKVDDIIRSISRQLQEACFAAGEIAYDDRADRETTLAFLAPMLERLDEHQLYVLLSIVLEMQATIKSEGAA